MPHNNNSLTLYRRTFPKYSAGFFALPNFNIYTLERPLITGDEWRGGKPNESCVPFGTYEIEHHKSAKFGEVWALVNEKLGVYHYPGDRQYKTDRYAILIHVANFVHEVQGCIAAGLGVGVTSYKPDPMVTDSRSAIERLREYLPYYDTITIKAL